MCGTKLIIIPIHAVFIVAIHGMDCLKSQIQRPMTDGYN